ncbi:BsuPI-related putative proteinase inhibitor [Halegenticoccus tardaugens]|uniref:BsuPI-related putative proteinase inhibitor n=1 Tax=Halegenticoccus tardaugens TaxID=2071624 RepID=UPI00100A628C|nr:BsuPI-related putative proteinase inhibitor [Halegenticoccus tardaugens]
MLDATLSVTPSADRVRFALAVENAGDDPITLSFRDGRRADFVVRSDGEEVWRWSDGRMFTQVLASETLDSGERARYDGEWEEPTPGSYVAVGVLAADGVDLEAEASFSV